MSTLSEMLQAVLGTKQTGYLKIQEGEHEGFLAVENGTIVNAKTGSYIALQALFQLVGWKEAHFEFHERPIPEDLTRDLAVYEPQVLIQGIDKKTRELAALEEAIPSFDSVLRYVGGEAHGSIEATSTDLGLLNLANGHRSVREISEMVKLSPLEVARSLARFRAPGVLELLPAKATRSKSMAETR